MVELLNLKQFDLGGYLSDRKKLIDNALDQAIRPRYPAKIYESMRYSLLAGGKRIRSILCLAATELGGGETSTAIPTACALEMLHTGSLIHDDLPVMDDDDFRRGRPTNHKVFGEDVALLAGDAFLSYALEFVLDKTRDVPHDRLVRVLRVMLGMVGVSGLVAGQLVDLESERRTDVDLATLEFIHAHKTAAMIDAAVVTGAIIAGAGDGTVDRLSRYATRIGMAFQIVDDVLDVTGTFEELGKTPHKDGAAGKATFPRLLGVAESVRRARELTDAAKRELRPFGERAAPLLAVADYICDRRK